MNRSVIVSGITRACSVFSSLAWLTVLWALCSLPLVTIPFATVALYDGATRLLDGDGPSWRRFLFTMGNRATTTVLATAFIAIPGALALSLAWLARSGAGPAASGAALAATAVTAVLMVLAPVACLTAPTPEGVVRQIGVLAVSRPVRAVAALIPWAASMIIFTICPPQLIIVFAFVAVSLGAVGSVAILAPGRTGPSPHTFVRAIPQ
ncbi:MULTISPECIES: hypothetical protein [unclassified Streptomyces]|uniref:hypothetical protein n=1 Tax=unclassified Streptomyces TaxID=2593676 RepID=UPI0009389D52|nr:hypothetical protein [Streptomyces sp. TSRI0281]